MWWCIGPEGRELQVAGGCAWPRAGAEAEVHSQEVRERCRWKVVLRRPRRERGADRRWRCTALVGREEVHRPREGAEVEVHM